jgi:hypothetical protein
MDDAYDKWFNEERDAKGEWGDVLRSAYDAGLKRGLAADKFDPYDDDYDPRRAELLTLAGQLAVADSNRPSGAARAAWGETQVAEAQAVIDAVNARHPEVSHAG